MVCIQTRRGWRSVDHSSSVNPGSKVSFILVNLFDTRVLTSSYRGCSIAGDIPSLGFQSLQLRGGRGSILWKYVFSSAGGG